MRGLAGLDRLLDQGQHFRRKHAPSPPVVLHQMLADALDAHSSRSYQLPDAPPPPKLPPPPLKPPLSLELLPPENDPPPPDQLTAATAARRRAIIGEHREDESNDRRDRTTAPATRSKTTPAPR